MKSRIQLFSCVFVVIFITYTMSINAQSRKKSRTGIDYTACIDSIELLRERYCDMLVYAPERASGTLNNIVAKFRTLPKDKKESLLKTHYSVIVALYEQERLQRASAFADCYYALAKPDDSNLGALYLNDIVLAIEGLEEDKLRKRIDSLRVYANLNNLNYDQDLMEAEENYISVKQRCNFRKHSLKDFLDSGFWMIDIDELANTYGESALEWLIYVPFMVELDGTRIKRYSFHQKPKKNKTGDMFVESLSTVSGDYGFDFDIESKTMYSIWGREQTHSANPILLSGARQTVQSSHAMVSGELARKKYSYGQRLAGNAAATIVDAGFNALFDWLSVTTEHYYRCELSLTMTNPNTLEGELAFASTTVKSNNLGNPDTKKGSIRLKYYKTKPLFGYCPMYKKKPLYSGTMKKEQFESLAIQFAETSKALELDYKKFKKENKDEKLLFYDFESKYNHDIIANLRKMAHESLATHPITK